MYKLLGVLLFLGGSVANAEPGCITSSNNNIPPEVRVQVWNQFLQDNPNTEHRQKILKEIEQALGEMWGSPECDALLRDATVNPFKSPPEKKVTSQTPSLSFSDETVDPFHPQDGMLVDPFKKKAPTPNAGQRLDENSTYNPFSPSTPQGPKGPKKPAGNFTVDPWAPKAIPPDPPKIIEDDGVLVDPFRKRKSK
jgi:hypothetical protein